MSDVDEQLGVNRRYGVVVVEEGDHGQDVFEKGKDPLGGVRTRHRPGPLNAFPISRRW